MHNRRCVTVGVVRNDDRYADGDMAHWDVFMRKIEPIASRVPYQVGAAPRPHPLYAAKMGRELVFACSSCTGCA